MHPEIEALANRAEDRYLTPGELEDLRQCIQTLGQRLEVYEMIRDRELEIFQPIADRLVAAFPHQEQIVLEKSLKQWLSILRYSAIAMLNNNPQILTNQLLSWFKGIVDTHETHKIETKLYQLLQARLKELLSNRAMSLIQPFIAEAETVLLRRRELLRR